MDNNSRDRDRDRDRDRRKKLPTSSNNNNRQPQEPIPKVKYQQYFQIPQKQNEIEYEETNEEKMQRLFTEFRDCMQNLKDNEVNVDALNKKKKLEYFLKDYPDWKKAHERPTLGRFYPRSNYWWTKPWEELTRKEYDELMLIYKRKRELTGDQAADRDNETRNISRVLVEIRKDESSPVKPIIEMGWVRNRFTGKGKRIWRVTNATTERQVENRYKHAEHIHESYDKVTGIILENVQLGLRKRNAKIETEVRLQYQTTKDRKRRTDNNSSNSNNDSEDKE